MSTPSKRIIISMILVASLLLAAWPATALAASSTGQASNSTPTSQPAASQAISSRKTSSQTSTNPYEARPFTARTVKVQLLSINDFYGQLNTTKTIGDRQAGRADYLAAYFRQRERENPNTLIVHAGDAVGASPPVSSLLKDEPTIEFFNLAGFDVATPGNQEFDRGVAEMLRLIRGDRYASRNAGKFRGANFPYVSANIINKKTGRPLLPPFTIKWVGGVPIGFIGVTTTETPSIVIAGAVESVQFIDEVTAINRAVKQLKRRHVQTIVVLAHADGFFNEDTRQVDGKLAAIANQVDDEVDVIIGGHSQTLLNHVVDGKLIVEARNNGMAFADIDLRIDRRTRDVVSKTAEVVTNWQDLISPAARITRLITDSEAKVAPLVNEVVGTASVDLTRTPNAAGESNLGNLIADAQRWQMDADIALTNPGGIRADIAAGAVTWGELYAAQPFNNDMVKMTLTGTQIRDVLNQQFTVSRMLQISGLTYTWQNNAVVDIFLPGGAALDPAASYTVAMNKFLAGGGDGFTLLASGTNWIIGPTDLEALVDYVKQLPQPFTAKIEGRITKLG